MGHFSRWALALAALAAAPLGAQSAHFIVNGRAVTVGDGTARSAVATSIKADAAFGQLADGRLVIGVGSLEVAPGGDTVKGLSLRLATPASRETKIAADVQRAYPAPVGDDVAIITIEHAARLWDGSRVLDLPIEQRVTQLSWFPDGQAFVFTGFPSDWSPSRLNNAPTTEEFLRLNTPGIFRFDLASGEVTALIVGSSPEWSPVVSPDGHAMAFNHTVFETRATLALFDFATSVITPLNASVPEGSYEENLPPALTGQIAWRPDGRQIIFATTRPDTGAHEVIAVSRDGTGRTVLGHGTDPQVIAGGAAVAFLSEEGTIETVGLGGGD